MIFRSVEQVMTELRLRRAIELVAGANASGDGHRRPYQGDKTKNRDGKENSHQ